MARQTNSTKSTNKTDSDKLKCLKCESLKAPNTQNYYANTSPLFSSEKLMICKDCINKYIGEKDSKGYTDRVKLVLALMNKPFLVDQWELRDKDWSKYAPPISSLPQYRGMTYADSTFANHSVTTENRSQDGFEINDSSLTQEEIKLLSSFWGKGHESEDLEFLQNEYDKLINSYECDSYAMEMLFQEVAQLRLTIKKNRENSKPVDKELKTLQDLLGSANIKPVQETGANATEQATFGTLIKKYENDRPVPEPDPAWQDVDEVKKYVQVWFLGHLCKMLGINNEYARMYEEEIAKHTVDTPTYENDEDDEDGELK